MTTEAEATTPAILAPDDYNGCTDWWYYVVGVNVIPSGSVELTPGVFKKQPIIDWKNGPVNYQENSVLIEQHEEWKEKVNTVTDSLL